MSDTKVDMAKVTQMLDAGWLVRIWKGPMGSYEVRARHSTNKLKFNEVIKKLVVGDSYADALEFHTDDGWIMTDDFTPDQALTRMAYKVHGEII